jgi:hypothetical protein
VRGFARFGAYPDRVPSRRSLNGPVRVHRFDPGSGWTLDEARGLLDQGYSVTHVERRTGWPRPMLLAGGRRAQRS